MRAGLRGREGGGRGWRLWLVHGGKKGAERESAQRTLPQALVWDPLGPHTRNGVCMGVAAANICAKTGGPGVSRRKLRQRNPRDRHGAGLLSAGGLQELAGGGLPEAGGEAGRLLAGLW